MRQAFLAATHADGNVTELDLFTFQGQQTPASINALAKPAILHDVEFTPGQPVSILIPPTGTFTTPPVMVDGPAGSTVALALGGAKGSIQLRHKDNQDVLGPLDVDVSVP